MGRKCSVPQCRSNYTPKERIPTFSFPANDQMRSFWLRQINRTNFQPTKYSGVCILHFEEKYIQRSMSVTADDGTVLTAQRKRLILTADAFPTVFSNFPTVMIPKTRSKRKISSDDETRVREENIKHELDEKLEEYEAMIKSELDDNTLDINLESEDTLGGFEPQFEQVDITDQIFTYMEFKQQCSDHVPGQWLINTESDQVIIFKLSEEGVPKILTCLKIMADLTIETSYDGKKCQPYILKDLFRHGPPRLTKWSEMRTILDFLDTFQLNRTNDLEKILSLLDEYTDKISSIDKNKPKLRFIKEQLEFVLNKRRRYSPQLIEVASELSSLYPAAYRLLRESECLFLPHPKYLKSLGIRTQDLSK